ncbi:MAG: Acetoin dehydrogenase E1 component alpha-subunit [uncultured Thermoleophilia bacterium]|uniref:Acetoin dehydrogenase E1 component alpha-subunit n=1 Tax=uncultured Thermoleophilia bacterium TaxID=1497501 RepID=A0A6J4TXD5_9ACTN|nr:MAG: Acetoin dehydrogenase E1 component alpha-subunit [uncultured Thermoleophilia bacterium]
MTDTHTLPVLLELSVPGSRPTDVDDDELRRRYHEMARIRAIEEEVVDAFAKGLIPGSTHPSIGQEAIPVGTIAVLRPDDQVLATYRGHGEALAKGMDPVAMMAELMTRETGVCKGKGGSMHLSEPSIGLVSTNAIVAGHIPMAGGVALAAQRRGRGQVVACYFGDGAACEGEFFETLNMAQLWRLPLVFVCANNGFAISVPTRLSQATPDIADRATGFGMANEIVDGNDVTAVAAAMGRAVERARAGEGPTLIECKTVRWERHSAFSAGGNDPAEARRRREAVDPLQRYRRALVAWGVADDAALDAVDEEVRVLAAEVRAEAERAPAPGPQSIWEDVFAPGPPR